MKIGIASKNEPFARRNDPESTAPTTIPGPKSGRDLFGGWGPRL